MKLNKLKTGVSGGDSVKSRWNLIASIFQLIVGILAIVAFMVIGISGEIMIKWIGTLVLSVAFVVLGIIGIVNYKSNK